MTTYSRPQKCLGCGTDLTWDNEVRKFMDNKTGSLHDCPHKDLLKQRLEEKKLRKEQQPQQQQQRLYSGSYTVGGSGGVRETGQQQQFPQKSEQWVMIDQIDRIERKLEQILKKLEQIESVGNHTAQTVDDDLFLAGDDEDLSNDTYSSINSASSQISHDSNIQQQQDRHGGNEDI